MPLRIAYEEDFPDSPNYRPRNQQEEAPTRTEGEVLLKEEALKHMVLAWHKLVRANEDAAATVAEEAGKTIFGAERFGEAMVKAIEDGGNDAEFEEGGQAA